MPFVREESRSLQMPRRDGTADLVEVMRRRERHLNAPESAGQPSEASRPSGMSTKTSRVLSPPRQKRLLRGRAQRRAGRKLRAQSTRARDMARRA